MNALERKWFLVISWFVVLLMSGAWFHGWGVDEIVGLLIALVVVFRKVTER